MLSELLPRVEKRVDIYSQKICTDIYLVPSRSRSSGVKGVMGRITPCSRSALVPMIPLSRFPLVSSPLASRLFRAPSKPWESLWRRQHWRISQVRHAKNSETDSERRNLFSEVSITVTTMEMMSADVIKLNDDIFSLIFWEERNSL